MFLCVNDLRLLEELRSNLQEVSGLNFSVELNDNNKLPFLDVMVDASSDNFITSVYRKPTNAGKCMNGESECTAEYKRGVIKAYVRRAIKVGQTCNLNHVIKICQTTSAGTARLRSTTIGQDICDAVLQCVDQHSLDPSCLVCVATDGAPAMVGEKKGSASLLVRHCEAAGYTQPINIMHCSIHQESLCAKSTNLVDVMSVVVKVLSRSLNHRQFQVLMHEVNIHYNDLLYFCEVRWLSRGAMLSRLCDLQQEIATFLRQKNLPHADQFSDPRLPARLALLTDITAHLNALNMMLQGKDILVTDMYEHITAFKVKARLWEAQLASGVRVLAADFKFFTAPFDFPVEDAPASLQMELVELQCIDDMKAKFHAFSPLSFFRDIVLPSNNFQKYIAHVQRIVGMFGSTYYCEQLFSKMKYTNAHLRSQLSDRHLNDILLLSTSTIEPDMEILLHGKQHQQSH
ncbi:general transcription factor II-I repeat domain-containing protein 2-like [Oratosquilla oratoria]|uniref:general transcription factor II-I repeat domain-containing protein 2-like n=1 Tax=Oratosquilla oratoria TaxID=337810 RepID=UPI003F75F3F8